MKAQLKFSSQTFKVSILALLLATQAQGAVFRAVRDPSLLPSPVATERPLRNTAAKVVLADYALIREDFPALAAKSEREIDAWLESNALIAEGQASQTEFNSPIQSSDYSGRALRPRDYGRSMVADTGIGLLDQKGAGSDRPRYDWEDGDPRNGNTTLGEALREFVFSKLVHRVLEVSGSRFTSVRCYAVLSNGFSVIHRDNKRAATGTSPAGTLFRQAHTRFEDPQAAEKADQGKYFLWNQADSLEIERVLRRFGITSVGSGRAAGATEGGINIQGTKDGAILDFGNFVVMDRFPDRAETHFYGQKALIAPGGDFPQPDPRLAVPTSAWGTYVPGQVDSKMDKAWVYAHQTAVYVARKFEEGDFAAGRSAAESFENQMLDLAVMKPTGCGGLFSL